MAVSYRIWLIVVILIMVLAIIIITGINIYEFYLLSTGKTVSNSVGTTMMWINIAATVIGFIVLILCVWFLVSRLNSSSKKQINEQSQTQQMRQMQQPQQTPQMQQPQQYQMQQPQQYQMQQPQQYQMQQNPGYQTYPNGNSVRRAAGQTSS